MSQAELLARIRVVLVETSHPGNIGAAARAMKTMGLARLVLVKPRFFPHADADARASGAVELLRSATVCESLDEALRETTLACALSARRRDLTPEALDAADAARELVRHAGEHEAAVVFGPERVGLSIADVSRCQRLVRIAADPAYPSLNLAAAVQIVAYELRRAAPGDAAAEPQATRLRPANHEEVERLIAHMEQSMLATGFIDRERPGRIVQRMRRLFARARPEPEEVAILRGFLHSIDALRDR
jgi:tRNA/rRNA methyltransferase